MESLNLLEIKLFGSFGASIGDVPVKWHRRREVQIIKYLALRPSASASRLELAKVFWPRSRQRAAAHGVRTACSNIRRAIGSIVGMERVALYFVADQNIALSGVNVRTDVGRFRAQVNAGDAMFDAGDRREAFERYCAAEEICGAERLLANDELLPWFKQEAESLDLRRTIILERLAQIAFDFNDVQSAAAYAQRLRVLRGDSDGLVRSLADVSPQFLGHSVVAPLEEHRQVHDA